MSEEILGTIYTDVSDDFLRGVYPIARTIKATKPDLAIVIRCRGGDFLNPIKESAILTPKRTEYGKAIRKEYEKGNIKESRHNMTELEPRNDSISNTLTTVQKDNLLLEVCVKQVGNIVDSSGWDNPQAGRIYSVDGLSPTLNTCQGGQREPKVIVSMRGRNPENPSDRTAGIPLQQRLEPNSQGISNTLTSVQKDNMVLETVRIKQATKDGYIDCNLGGVADLSYPSSNTRRGRVQENGNVSPTITAKETGVCRIESSYRIRKLTPKECWRLMGFSDKDFEKAAVVNSNSQLYKQAGNSIVENCLIAIFSQLGIKGVQKWNDGLKDKYG